MKPPAPAARVVGHPVIAGLIVLAGAPFAIVCALRGGDGLFLAVIMGVILERVMRANASVMEYRAWKSAWDAMADQPPRPKRGMAIARVVVAVLAGLFALTHIRDPQVLGGLVFIGLGLGLWVVVSIGRRLGIGFGRRARPSTSDLVTIAVRGPVMPIPTLQQAFAMLPEHCQCLRQAASY